MADFVSALLRLERDELARLPPSSLNSAGIFSSPTEQSLHALVSKVSDLCPDAFYDIGSGTGVVVAAVANTVCKARGVELNKALHEAATRICSKAGSTNVRLTHADALRVAPPKRCPAMIYALDIRYPDILVGKIFDLFMKAPSPSYLLTTKNEQGLGAALCGVTRDLLDATFDCMSLVGEEPETEEEAEEAKEAKEILQAIREQALEIYDIESKGIVTLLATFDFCYGGASRSESDEIPIEAEQYENLKGEVSEESNAELLDVETLGGKETLEKLWTGETRGRSGALERTTMHVFEKQTCYGCREGQGAQHAHMEWDGCMYEKSE